MKDLGITDIHLYGLEGPEMSSADRFDAWFYGRATRFGVFLDDLFDRLRYNASLAKTAVANQTSAFAHVASNTVRGFAHRSRDGHDNDDIPMQSLPSRTLVSLDGQPSASGNKLHMG